jgi:DNA-binding CsgD family transcriptional regulator
MKATGIDTRGRQMLELLAEGASARVVARKLGYSEGTTRVYLHNLYKQIGVRNKTEAVIWYLNRSRAQEQRPAQGVPAPSPQPLTIPAQAALSLGDMSLSEDLYTALGAMSSFLGPYGYVWEAGLRLKGASLDEKGVARRAQSRLLWRALLKADYAYAKLVHDEGHAEAMLQDSPSDAVLLASLLLLGGYSSASEKVIGALASKRKGAGASTARRGARIRRGRAHRAPRAGGRERTLARREADGDGLSLPGVPGAQGCGTGALDGDGLVGRSRVGAPAARGDGGASPRPRACAPASRPRRREGIRRARKGDRHALSALGRLSHLSSRASGRRDTPAAIPRANLAGKPAVFFISITRSAAVCIGRT